MSFFSPASFAKTAEDRLSPRELLLLALVALTLFLPGFARLPPTDRDESRYLTTSERMAETGDIVDLRYQELPRYLQPAGIYWLQAAATTVFDSPAHTQVWAYRLPSLLAALAAVLMTGFAGARLFGRNTGLAAALILASCFSLNFEARIAKTDAVLLASITLAQLAMMRAYLAPTTAGRLNAVAFWAALGVGLMVKGPVILLVTGSTFLGLWAWDRKISWAKALRPTWGPLITLAIALPWYIAIGVKTDGDFYQRALMKNFLGKAGDSEQGHKGPFGYHLALLIVTFWPGSLLIFRAVGHAWRERVSAPGRFLLCWAIPTWILFELVATKLPHYVLPAYPPLALMAAAALFAPNSEAVKTPRWGRYLFWAVAALWVVISVILSLAAPIGLLQTEHRVSILAFVLGAGGLIAALAALGLLLRGQTLACVGALTLAAVFVWSNTFGLTLPQLQSLWLSPRIAAAARAVRGCETGKLVTTPYSEPSLVFLYGRDRTILTPDGPATVRALASDAACGVALVGAEDRIPFLTAAQAFGLPVRAVGKVTGQNYSTGDDQDLTLYRVGH
jgi:4-amino-4-deoxy-L-arabinose transferase-like glycosyltransferase